MSGSENSVGDSFRDNRARIAEKGLLAEPIAKRRPNISFSIEVAGDMKPMTTNKEGRAVLAIQRWMKKAPQCRREAERYRRDYRCETA